MAKPFNPQSTIFTNIALDHIMPKISPNAWKILCFAIRKTAGWADISTNSGRKESDVISISQFREGCGISSNDTVLRAIEECLQNGYLIRVKHGVSFRYYVNTDYELPSVTETVMPTVTETVTMTVTETVNTNNNINYNINTNSADFFQNNQQPGEKGNGMNKEEYTKAVNRSVNKSMVNPLAAYASYPEDIVPVVERMEKLWNFRSPSPSKKKNGQYGLWIESCNEILEACGEFGVKLLDILHDDWDAYLDSHGGCAPYTISSPRSLVSAVYAKAAMLRGGNNARLWGTPVQKRKSILDI